MEPQEKAALSVLGTKAGNITSYAADTLGSLQALPFSAVDSLILSQICYTDFTGLVPGLSEQNSAGVRLQSLLQTEHFGTMYRHVLSAEKSRELLFHLAASPRWRDARLNWYQDSHNAVLEEQFGAVTFLLGDGTAYLAFRGTDITLLGWKEDFNMTYLSPVPSQTAAVHYLNTVAQKCDCPLRLGGHSKGGNLAVYAAMMTSDAVRGRIRGIYSHDGPGFRREIVASDAYRAVCSRVNKTVPQSSTVGLLLQSTEEYKVVKSDRVGGLFQHDPFSWEVRSGAFISMPDLTASAKHLNEVVEQWLGSVPDTTRAELVGALWQVVQASGAETFTDLAENWPKALPAMAKAAGGLDKETREHALTVGKALAEISLKAILPAKSEDETAHSVK